MKGIANLVVGFTGMGKTHFIRECLRKVHPDARLVFDVNNEYSDLFNEPFNDDIEAFAERAYKVQRAFVVFEESTGFISNKGSTKIFEKTLVKKRHSQNMIFLVFHSFRAIPFNIYNLCNMVTVFKTQETPDFVAGKFNNPRLTETFTRIAAAPMIAGRYSPFEIAYI